MIDRNSNIDPVQQIADSSGDSVVRPIAGLTKECEKALSGRDIASRSGAYSVEELTVLRYSAAEGRLTPVLTDRPNFGQVQQAFQQRHRHLQ